MTKAEVDAKLGNLTINFLEGNVLNLNISAFLQDAPNK
jgi:hypothetical protein